jgi:hypothetical protein
VERQQKFVWQQFHGRFPRRADFLLQDGAILRNAARIRFPETPSVCKNAQDRENLRKKPLLNYESPALTAELQAHSKTNYANGKIQKEQDQSEAQPHGS